MERSKFVAAVLAFTLSLCLVGSAFAEEPADQQTITSANGQMLNSHPQIPQNVLGPAVLWHLVVSNGYQGLSYGSWIDGVAASTPGPLTLSKSVNGLEQLYRDTHCKI